MHILLCFLLICLSPSLSASIPFFAAKIQRGTSGDYIVTHQNGLYSLLLLRSHSGTGTIFEEITVPENGIDLANISWAQWLHNRAPGHGSWIQFEVDITKGVLLEQYSISQGGWLALDGQEHIFATLLRLPATRIPLADRKKIGPSPLPGETDVRALWHPPVYFEGKRRISTTEAWRAEWPTDTSPLASSQLDLYYDTLLPDFPFPIWLEIYGGHYHAQFPVIHAGQEIRSPAPEMPRRTPVITQLKHHEGLTVYLRCPHYYPSLHLFAMEVGDALGPALPLPAAQNQHAGEVRELIINAADLSATLKKGSRYRLALTADNDPSTYTESIETFVW